MANKPFARSHLRRRRPAGVRLPHAAGASFTPLEVATYYGLPKTLDGSGQTIGIVELGGAFSQNDFDAYMKFLGLPTQTVTIVPVAGGGQQDDPGGANVEVMLDVEICAAIAPKSKIRVYFAPNTDTGFVAAVEQAALECDVVSISWGAPESQWSASSRAAMDTAFQKAIAGGVSVFVAAGDNGSSDGGQGDNADYPASSPYSVACGGTRIEGGVETVWDDGAQGGATGGGYSAYYQRPSYQDGIVNKANRGVPDVAGLADPETGWVITADGQQGVVGGTSAVAPMWAAIAALLNQAAGARTGYLNRLAYAHPSAFHDITAGNNGDFKAGAGWDACTGLGTPNGPRLFALVGGTTQPPSPPPAPPPSPPPVVPPSPPVGNPVATFMVIADQAEAPLATYRLTRLDGRTVPAAPKALPPSVWASLVNVALPWLWNGVLWVLSLKKPKPPKPPTPKPQPPLGFVQSMRIYDATGAEEAYYGLTRLS